MEKLLQNVIEAHGGLTRWQGFNKVVVQMVSSGKLFDLRGFPQDTTPREMTAYLHEQRASVQPFGAAHLKTNFTPERIAIETLAAELVSERTGTAESIHQHMTTASWDPLDRAYFNGYAMWTYLNTPFFMVLPGFKVTEIEPLQYDNETWRGLSVTFPKDIASHCAVQDFYFGNDFLLRRHDYVIDVAGDFNALQYVSNYKEVQGISLPTRRRAYKKGNDGLHLADELMVSIDLSDIRFS